MNEFLFLFRGPAPTGSPEQMQQIMKRWMDWAKGLTEKGHLKAPGHPLERTGKLVSGKQMTITDGPYAEKDVVSGYMLVSAENMDRAVELSLGCPIFETTGGAVEVRPILKITM